MSQRRKVGDAVWLRANAGFVGDSNRLQAEIRPEDETMAAGCVMNCGDPDCREWETLWTEPDPLDNGKRHTLCHVSECLMFDEQQK